MKKLFTLCAAFLMCGTSAMAQEDNTFDFVDADGNVVADGSVWEVSERTEEALSNGTVMSAYINSGLYVRNNSTESASCSIDYQVTQLSGGNFQICFPVVCWAVSSVMSAPVNTGTGTLSGSATQDIQTEWLTMSYGTDEVYGTCEATLQLYTVNDDGTTTTNSKITVRFVNTDSTTDGIDGVSATYTNEPVAYYSLDGSQRPVAQKGINIVKYADGSVRKVVVK